MFAAEGGCRLLWTAVECCELLWAGTELTVLLVMKTNENDAVLARKILKARENSELICFWVYRHNAKYDYNTIRFGAVYHLRICSAFLFLDGLMAFSLSHTGDVLSSPLLTIVADVITDFFDFDKHVFLPPHRIRI